MDRKKNGHRTTTGLAPTNGSKKMSTGSRTLARKRTIRIFSTRSRKMTGEAVVAEGVYE